MYVRTILFALLSFGFISCSSIDVQEAPDQKFSEQAEQKNEKPKRVKIKKTISRIEKNDRY